MARSSCGRARRQRGAPAADGVVAAALSLSIRSPGPEPSRATASAPPGPRVLVEIAEAVITILMERDLHDSNCAFSIGSVQHQLGANLAGLFADIAERNLPRQRWRVRNARDVSGLLSYVTALGIAHGAAFNATFLRKIRFIHINSEARNAPLYARHLKGLPPARTSVG